MAAGCCLHDGKSCGKPIPLARYAWLGLPGFVLLCWILAVRHLSTEWQFNEQYNYGWVVPVLALYLVRIRLDNVPTADSVRRQWTVPTGLLLIAVAEALLLPVREANADWRLLGWILTGLAAAATLIAFAQAGGALMDGSFHIPGAVLFHGGAVAAADRNRRHAMADAT